MDKNENSINDFQEQYDILVEEEQEKQRKKAFWIIFFCLLILLFAVLGATYSYYRVYINTEKSNLNMDTNGDGKPDLNVDLNDDGICDVNCDTNGDGKPDLNIDYNNDLKPRFNLDLDGDGKPDTNLINQDNQNGIACTLDKVCDLNCDTTGDNHPDINVDMDGDGKPDINIDTDCDGKPDINIDKDGDGKCDFNCDTDGDGVCDKYCDGDKPDDKPKEEKPKEEKPIVEVKPSDEDENAILNINYIQGVNVLFTQAYNPEMPETLEGARATQTFTVKNESNRTIVFNLNWINVNNEFNVKEGLTYLIRRDGNTITGEVPTPSGDGNLLNKIVIPAGTTYSYEVDYTFHNLPEKDQTMDLNKTFTAQIIAEIINQ